MARRREAAGKPWWEIPTRTRRELSGIAARRTRHAIEKKQGERKEEEKLAVSASNKMKGQEKEGGGEAQQRCLYDAPAANAHARA